MFSAVNVHLTAVSRKIVFLIWGSIWVNYNHYEQQSMIHVSGFAVRWLVWFKAGPREAIFQNVQSSRMLWDLIWSRANHVKCWPRSICGSFSRTDISLACLRLIVRDLARPCKQTVFSVLSSAAGWLVRRGEWRRDGVGQGWSGETKHKRGALAKCKTQWGKR